MYLHITALLFLAGTTAVHALNWKTGIDLSLSGTAGTDYVVEQLYHDSLYDDRSVIYMKSTVQISMENNDRNQMNMRYDPVTGAVIDQNVLTDSGWIYYKIDGDELRAGYPYGRASQGPDPAYSGPYFFYDGPVSFTSVKGQIGDNGLPYTDKKRYHYGITDSLGDEWHVLTYWHDVGNGTGESSTDDGKIVLLVLDPGTPAIRFDCATDAAEYYTTPPKQYYIPVIFTQTTYLTADVIIRLTNITDTETVYYRVDDGMWTAYTAPLISQNIFSGTDSKHTLSFRLGTSGTIKTRAIHYRPASPTAAETHPSKMCWHTQAEKDAIKTRMAQAPYSSLYNGYKSANTISGQTDRHHKGLRYGKREYYNTSPVLSRITFVCAMEGYDYLTYSFANVAKEMLLSLYAIDPVGFEEAQIAGQRRSPCMERCAYPGDHKGPGIPMAYDMMAAYTTANGYADGFTPIQEYKVRDGMASEVNLRLKWLGVGYGDFWHNYLENAFAAFAIAMPSYDTPYYGTSGVDGTPATHANAPFPDQRISWWDYVNGIGEPAGYPDLGAKSTYHCLYDGPFGLGIWAEDGYWYCDDFNGYQSLTEAGAVPSVAVRARYDGIIPPRFAARLDFHIRTRHPGTGKSTGENACDGFLQTDVKALINSSVADAGLYRWHQGFPDATRVNRVSGVTDLLYFDNTIAPEAPEVQSKKYQSIISMGAGIDQQTGTVLRLLNKYENSDASNYRVPLTTHFNLDAYGQMLVVDGLSGRNDTDGKAPEGRNVILVDDDALTRNNGLSKMVMGRIGPALFGTFAGYGRVTTRRDLGSNDNSVFFAQQIDQTRHVLFADRKFFIIIDELDSGTGSHTYGWTLHGSSDGSTDPSRFSVDNTAHTATWVKNDGVSLKAAFISPAVTIDGSNTDYSYFTAAEEPYIIASATGTDVRFVTALLPLDNGQAAPVITGITVSAGTAFSMNDGSGPVYCHTQDGSGTVSVGSAYSSDGTISLVKTGTSGAFSYGTVINGTHLTNGGTALITSSAPMNIYLGKPASGDTLVRFMVKPDTDAVEIPVSITIGGLSAATAYGVLRDGQADTNVTTDAAGNAVIGVLALNDVFGQEPREYAVTTGTVGITRTGAPTAGIPAFSNPVRIGTGFTAPAGALLFDHTGMTVPRVTEPGVYYLQFGDAVRKLILVD